MRPKSPLKLDGKIIRKFLFARRSYLDNHAVFVEVDAFDKDHALKRLEEKYAYVDRRDWDFLEELGMEHFIGSTAGTMGEYLPLLPEGTLLAPGSANSQ